MRALNKKVVTGVAAGTLVLAGTGVAYAYWTATGEGAGSASTATGESNLTITQTSTIAGLAPGAAAQPITGTVANAAEASAFVASVTVTIASVDQAAGATGTCDATDYVIENGLMTVGTNVAPGADVDFSGATIAFVDKADANQDGCKGATVNQAYAAS